MSMVTFCSLAISVPGPNMTYISLPSLPPFCPGYNWMPSHIVRCLFIYFGGVHISSYPLCTHELIEYGCVFDIYISTENIIMVNCYKIVSHSSCLVTWFGGEAIDLYHKNSLHYIPVFQSVHCLFVSRYKTLSITLRLTGC